MKFVLTLLIGVCALASAQGQVLRPGVGGRHLRHEGVRHEREGRVEWQHGGHFGRDYRYALGHGHGYRPVFDHRTYWGYGYDYPWGYSYGPTNGYGYGSAAANGLWLGALAGGIIGHNSGDFRHSAWRGAAWGAGAGWLLGSIADANRPAVAYEAPRVVTVAQPVVTTAPTHVTRTVPAPPVTIVTPAYGNASPMAAANAMFGRN